MSSDLNLLGVCQVSCRHSEPTRCDLLDGGSSVPPFRIAPAAAPFVLSALSSIALPTQLVHCCRKSLVCLAGDGAIAHGTGAELLHNVLCVFDLFYWDRGPLLIADAQKPSQTTLPSQTIHFPVRLKISATDRKQQNTKLEILQQQQKMFS